MKGTLIALFLLIFPLATVAAGFFWIENRPDHMTWTWRIICSSAAAISLIALIILSWGEFAPERDPEPPKPVLHEELLRPMSAPEKIGMRLALGCAAVPFGLLAFWMMWIVRRFLNGNDWFDWIVGLVLHELILTVALFALALFTWALFAPSWLPRALKLATDNLVKAIITFFVLLIAGPPLVFGAMHVLVFLGILK